MLLTSTIFSIIYQDITLKIQRTVAERQLLQTRKAFARPKSSPARVPELQTPAFDSTYLRCIHKAMNSPKSPVSKGRPLTV